MITYIIVALCLGVLSIFGKKRWALLFAFLLLLIIGGFRDLSVGTDTLSYKSYFEDYGADVENVYHITEPLYLLIQFSIAVNGWPYQFQMFIVMAITLILLTIYALHASDNPVFSILCYFLLYFYFHSFNISRQYLAAPLLLMSFYYLDKGCTKKYLGCVIGACMFHSASIVGLVALLFRKKSWSKNLQIILLVLTYLIGITDIIPSIIGSYQGFQDESVLHYFSDDSRFRETGFSLTRLLLVIYSIFLMNNLENRSNLLSLLTFGLCVLNIFSYLPVAGRLAQFFTLVQIVIIPNIYSMAYNKKLVPIIRTVSICYMIVVWFYSLACNVGGVVPYEFGGLGF